MRRHNQVSSSSNLCVLPVSLQLLALAPRDPLCPKERVKARKEKRKKRGGEGGGEMEMEGGRGRRETEKIIKKRI